MFVAPGSEHAQIHLFNAPQHTRVLSSEHTATDVPMFPDTVYEPNAGSPTINLISGLSY